MTPEHESEIGRCIFREANDAFVIFHPTDQRVLDVNPAAQRLTGWRRQQLLRLTLLDLLEADSPHLLAELVYASRNTGYLASTDGYSVRKAGGEKQPVHVSVS